MTSDVVLTAAQEQRKAEAVADAKRILAGAYVSTLGLDGTSVHDAALAAYTPTGPSLEEIELRIATLRVKYAGEAAA